MRAGERGYALLLAIAVVAVLSLAVLASARAHGDIAASLSGLREREEEAIAAESVAARVAFLLTTEPMGPLGVLVGRDARGESRELRLDGRYLTVTRDVHVSVQDEAGLFNINGADQAGLAALLTQHGVNHDAERLAAALLDYVDEDDLARADGAEARSYARAGLGPPANKPVASRWQALEALGWRQAGLERSPVWDLLTANAPDAGININTAPEAVLRAVIGDRRRAQALVVRRDAAAVTDLAEVEALTAGAQRADGLALAVLPASSFRVQIAFGSLAAPHGVERRLRLAGEGAEQPFLWIEERHGRLNEGRDDEAIDVFPVSAPAS